MQKKTIRTFLGVCKNIMGNSCWGFQNHPPPSQNYLLFLNKNSEFI